MEQSEFLTQYEANLTQNLIRLCTDGGYLEGELLQTPDISDKWHNIAPHYVADAVKEIAQYPTVALGWAMYIGMAVAKFWDEDWTHYNTIDNLYTLVRDQRGFDYIDEVVRGEILGLTNTDYQKAEELVRQCAETAYNAIRHEQIEPQSQLAFHVFARSIKVLYNIGAAVWLNQMGYKLTPAYSVN